jgi:hypothetical protein
MVHMGGLSRNAGWVRAALVAAALAAGVTAWACADPSDPPTWELAKDRFDPGGSGAMLTPGNDTRVNLLLLLADRRGAPLRHSGVKEESPPLVLFPWDVMYVAARPPRAEGAASGWSPSRCQSNAGGAAAFAAAVRANGEVPDAEKARLIAARAAYTPNCWEPAAPLAAVAAASPAGRAFSAYLSGAADFYGERFDAARGTFAALAAAPDGWLRETALYMVARTELNRAQAASMDEYGWLAEPEKRDHSGIAAAKAAFAAYLQAYPDGRYAASARGLTRRVAWLAADHKTLAAAFDRQLAGSGAFEGAATAAVLTDEIDSTLLQPGGGAEARNPLLAAVIALQRMRCTDDYATPAEDCGPRLGREELARQAPLFAGEPELFGYLQAAEAFFVRREAREVLSLIPDAARQERFTYLAFSRQLLRGMALEATADRNARAFWLSLFPGAVQPYQREALELALALHDERHGGVDRIFAADSQVRHPVIRQILLEDVAGPDLLRRQARDGAVPKQERDVATYVLLAKSLHRGFYREFLGDLPLLPASVPPEEGWSPGARYYDALYNPELEPPPLARFLPTASRGEAGCPALADTVRQLSAAPQAIGPRLCLAEYFRSNGFDGFDSAERPAGRGLGTSRPQFPGSPYARLEVYKAVIADPAASAEQRALALNRALRCYAPVGNNSCGGTDVPIEQRRAWYARLKRDHAASRWAQTLKFYW